MVRRTDVHNMSSYQLSTLEKTALGLGLGFIPSPKRLTTNDSLINNFLQLIRNIRIRYAFRNRPDLDRTSKLYILAKPKKDWPPPASFPIEDYLNSTLTDLKRSLITLQTFKSPIPNMTALQRKALDNLLSNPSLRLDPADKSGVPVLSDTSAFNNECMRHLTSFSYREMTQAEASNTINNFAKRLRLLWSKQQSSARDYVLHQLNTRKFASFYILWKTHKPVVVGRPITGNVGYLSSNASRWVDEQLRPLVNRLPTVLHSSAHLARTLNHFSIPTAYNVSDITLSAMDVTALYPSINLHRGMEAVKRVIDDNPDIIDPNKSSLILNTLELILFNLVIEFNGRYFLQTCGTAMGTPAAVVFAVIFMYDLEKKLVTKFQQVGHLLLYYRYIDDIFTIFRSKKLATAFWKAFNRLDPDIQVSGHSGHSVDFMDLTIYKGNRLHESRQLDTSLFQKSICHFLYLPYNSCHPHQAKTAYIASELRRFALNNTESDNYYADAGAFKARLLSRGYRPKLLKEIFQTVSYTDRERILNTESSPLTSVPKPNPIVFKAPFDAKTTKCAIPTTLRTHRPVLDDEGNEIIPRIVYCNTLHENLLRITRRLRKAPRGPQELNQP